MREHAIILDDNGKENPWHRAGRLLGKLSPKNRLLLYLAMGSISLIFLAVASRPTPVIMPAPFVPISYEEFAAKQARQETIIHLSQSRGYVTVPWDTLTPAEKRKNWEREVAYEREWNDPVRKAERDRANQAFADLLAQQLNGARATMKGRNASVPYPYVTGSDPSELNGRDFAAP